MTGFRGGVKDSPGVVVNTANRPTLKSIPPATEATDDEWESIDESGSPLSQGARTTLAPPMGNTEYVQAMMELGELEDPSSEPPETRRGSTPEVSSGIATPVPMPSPAPPPPAARAAFNRPTIKERTRVGGFEIDASLRNDPSLLADFDAEPAPSPPPSARKAPAPPSSNLRGRMSVPGFAAPRLPSNVGGIPSLEEADEERPSSRRPTPDPGRSSLERRGTGAGDRLTPSDDELDFESLLEEAAPPPRAPTPPRYPSPPAQAPARSAGQAGLRLGGFGNTPPVRPTPIPEVYDEESGDRPTPLIEPPDDAWVTKQREMQSRLAAQNYAGALRLAEDLLAEHPEDRAASQCADRCREAMAQKYLTRLGGRTNVPKVVMSEQEIRWLALDHRAGFLLSFIDGGMPIEEVLDVASMPELDALRILFELREQGVIEIEAPARRGRR